MIDIEYAVLGSLDRAGISPQVSNLQFPYSSRFNITAITALPSRLFEVNQHPQTESFSMPPLRAAFKPDAAGIAIRLTRIG